MAASSAGFALAPDAGRPRERLPFCLDASICAGDGSRGMVLLTMVRGVWCDLFRISDFVLPRKGEAWVISPEACFSLRNYRDISEIRTEKTGKLKRLGEWWVAERQVDAGVTNRAGDDWGGRVVVTRVWWIVRREGRDELWRRIPSSLPPQWLRGRGFFELPPLRRGGGGGEFDCMSSRLPC